MYTYLVLIIIDENSLQFKEVEVTSSDTLCRCITFVSIRQIRWNYFKIEHYTYYYIDILSLNHRHPHVI